MTFFIILALVLSICLTLRGLDYLKYYLKKPTFFSNKTVLITGASYGLGKTIAIELYKLGAQIILCARSANELEKLKQELTQLPVSSKDPELLILDITSDNELVNEKIKKLTNKFQRIDVLINNAGVSYRGEGFTTGDEVFKKVMEVNFFSIIKIINSILPFMLKDKANDYSIVNMGSVQSYLGIPYRSAFCASKHALLAYSDCLRAELYAHKNINIITVQPGYIKTNVPCNALLGGRLINNLNNDDHNDCFSAEYVSHEIFKAVLTKKKEHLIVVWLHRLAIWIRFYLPEVFFYLMYKRAEKTFNKEFKK